jgi:hypothetical protein
VSAACTDSGAITPAVRVVAAAAAAVVVVVEASSVLVAGSGCPGLQLRFFDPLAAIRGIVL